MAQLEVPELTPIEQYNAHQARVSVCVSWVLTKAFGQKIPSDFEQPFYLGSQRQQLLKPALINQLTSSDIYCRVCTNSFKDSTLKWTGHMDVMQALSRKGIYVTDPHESAVTETLLMQNSPFKLSCHIAMIEALMTACTNELVTIERVVQAVRKFSSFNASSELPYDTEDALLFWINKVCGTVRHRIGKPEVPTEMGEVPLRAAVDQVMVPVMDDLLKDISDGCCLAVVISYYCPGALTLQDIAMTDHLGIADSLYNLQLIKRFCVDHLPMKCDHLTLNDLFHSPADLKPAVLVFLAELFHMLEVEKVRVARSVDKTTVVSPTVEHLEERPGTAKALTSAGVNKPPISTATKRSFQQGGESPGEKPTTAGSMSDINKTGVPPPRQALLPRRQPGRNGVEGSPVEDRGDMRQSVRAWEEQRSPSQDRLQNRTHDAITRGSAQSQLTNVTNLGQSQSSTLLANVSMDTEMSLDFTDSSVEISEFEETPRKTPVGPIVKSRPVGRPPGPGHPDHLELQSVSPNVTTRSTTGRNLQPLQPAPVRPSKERMNNNHTKEMESGEAVERKSPSSPAKPTSLNVSPSVTPGYTTVACESDGSSTPDEDYQTPSVESMPLPGEIQSPHRNGPPAHTAPATTTTPQPSGTIPEVKTAPRQRQYEAFYVNTGESINIPEPPTTSRLSGRDPTPVTESFVLHDQAYTAETARAAGIPVVGSPAVSVQRSGTGITCDVGSNESSDPELQKIRADHRDRETQGSPRPSESPRPESLGIAKQSAPRVPDDSPKTSFAQIKQQKENGNEAGDSVSVSQSSSGSLSLKAQFQNKGKGKPQKKTTFAALPNQTTWQENAKDSAKVSSPLSGGSVPATVPSSSELLDIKMRLEERRRQIEHGKRKMEVQWNKQRQRMGKQAFIQVINRNKSETDLQRIPELKEKGSPEEKKIVTRKGSHESTIEVDPRLSELVKSHQIRELPKRSVREGSSSKVVSAPASREQSIDREFRHVPVTHDRVEERLKSQSPQHSQSQSRQKDTPTSRAKESSVSYEKPTQSRKDQEPLKSNQNRLKPSPTKSRPKSYHAPESQPIADKRPLTPNTTAEQTRNRGSQSLTSSTDNPNLGGLTSLDRLNCSLSELQGEIMRLSLQQDQIKSLVVHDQTTTKPTRGASPPPPTVKTPTTDADKYYLYPRNSAGEPDVAGSSSTSSEVAPSSPQPPLPPQPETSTRQVSTHQPTSHAIAQPQPIYASQQPTQPPPVQPYPAQPHPPQQPYGAMPGFAAAPYPQYLPGQTQAMPMYPQMPPQYAPGMVPPQYQATGQMYQQNMFQQGYIPQQNQWAMAQQQQQIQQQQQQHLDSQQPQYSRATFQEPPHSLTSSTHLPGSMSSSTELALGADGALRHSSVMTASGSSTSSAAHTPSHAQPPPSPAVFQSPHTPTPTTDIMSTSMPSPGPASPAVSSPRQFWATESSSVSQAQAVAQDDRPQSEGFFITFDEGGTPSRPKPRFPSRDRRKDKSQDRGSPEKPAPAVPMTPPASADLPTPPRPRVPAESPVGFVIGEDETMVEKVGENSEALTDMEKKKEKMLQQQLKRMQEKQKKLQKLENKHTKLMDEHRTKQEKAEQKRAEEKSRREAIFQDYLKRKNEDSADDEPKSSAGSTASQPGPPLTRRPKGRGKATRPKSQPPHGAHVAGGGGGGSSSGGGEDGHSVSSQSHSSQEDLHSRGRSPASDAHGKHTGQAMAFPAGPGGPVDQTDAAYQQLAYGGMTHRRPPTPDKQKGSGVNGMDGGSTAPFATDIYSGPKLFKKPSMKSNRTIMINAISHCCLAGSVNTQVKNKVLEVIAKAEANHFVILFRDEGMQYKSIYTFDPDKDEVLKIHGVGPKQITVEMMDKFYKYNSGTKSFSEVTSTKHLSATIDALVIQNHLWQKKIPATRRPPNQY